jgi:hypothetical protein
MLILGLIGFWLYNKNEENLPFFILLTSIGLGLGVAWADRVRKTKGPGRFFGRILGSDDTLDEDTPKAN